MGNLIRMDLFRLRKIKGFWICVILAFLLAFSMTPLSRLLVFVSGFFGETEGNFPATADLSAILMDPYPLLNVMLAMLSASAFFYMDIENGYIKNIAGQMPQKGYTILSKFIAIIPHNILFAVVGIAGNLLGSLIFQKIIIDGDVTKGIVTVLLKILLLQSLCAILLLTGSTIGSKSLAVVISVVMGLGLTSLLYLGADSLLGQFFKNKKWLISDYMPDVLLGSRSPKVLVSVLSAVITIVIFMLPAIKIFDKKDVK